MRKGAENARRHSWARSAERLAGLLGLAPAEEEATAPPSAAGGGRDRAQGDHGRRGQRPTACRVVRHCADPRPVVRGCRAREVGAATAPLLLMLSAATAGIPEAMTYYIAKRHMPLRRLAATGSSSFLASASWRRP